MYAVTGPSGCGKTTTLYLLAGLDSMLLKRLGIQEEKFTMNVSCLSGGEQQRVMIARALANDSPVLLADEPTGNLDSDTADSIVQILKEIAHEEGKCVIVVTHFREIAASADVTIKLREKKLITEKS